jgi:hypothetical protein
MRVYVTVLLCANCTTNLVLARKWLSDYFAILFTRVATTAPVPRRVTLLLRIGSDSKNNFLDRATIIIDTVLSSRREFDDTTLLVSVDIISMGQTRLRIAKPGDLFPRRFF